MPYVSKKEREALGLPLSFGDVREDGYRFKHYYRNKPNSRVLEYWLSPNSWNNFQQYRAKNKKKNSLKMRRLIKRYKTFYGCSLCGYNKHPNAIHFDHIEPSNKFMEINKMSGYGKKSIKKEMDKCRLLCANCHAEHTANQMENGEI